MPIYRPRTSAWNARRRHPHFRRLLIALLAGGAGVLCARAAAAQLGKPPVYETVVTAAPEAAETPREDSAASASVITKDRTPRAGESVPQLLSEQAGVVVTRLGGMGSTATVSLRGSTSNQVLVYVDGVPYNTATGGGVDVGAIPLGDVQRIEIYRGTSPIGFGASAIGGVVAVTTTVPEQDAVSVTAGAGSFGTITADGTGSVAWRRVRVYGGLHFFDARGDFPYVKDQGTLDPNDDQTVRRQNAALRQVDGTVRALVPLGERRDLMGTVTWLDREQGLPGLGNMPTQAANLHSERFVGNLLYNSRDDLGAGGEVRANVYAIRSITRLSDQLREIMAAPTQSHDTTDTAGATARLQRPVATWLRLAGVLDGRLDRFVPRDDADAQRSGAPASRTFAAAGAEARSYWHAAGLEAVTSLRLERAHDERTGRDFFNRMSQTATSSTATIPVLRLALLETWSPQGSVHANLGRYGRMPSFVELYGNDGYILDNPGLRSESGWDVDVGATQTWRGERGTFGVTGAAFASWVEDLIQFQQAMPGRVRAKNIGRARVAGLEASVTATFGPHWRAFAQGTFTDARDTSDVLASHGKQLPLRPRLRSYARVELRDRPLFGRATFGCYVDLDVTTGNYADANNQNAFPARTLVGAGGNVTWNKTLSLILSAQNLGDSRVVDLIGYPLPGRAFYANLRWSYERKNP